MLVRTPSSLFSLFSVIPLIFTGYTYHTRISCILSCILKQIIQIFLWGVQASLHGTGGQKTRHFPGGWSGLIRRCFSHNQYCGQFCTRYFQKANPQGQIGCISSPWDLILRRIRCVAVNDGKALRTVSNNKIQRPLRSFLYILREMFPLLTSPKKTDTWTRAPHQSFSNFTTSSALQSSMLHNFSSVFIVMLWFLFNIVMV